MATIRRETPARRLETGGARDGAPGERLGDQGAGFFSLEGTIDFDPKICAASSPSTDCAGTLVFGVWTRPATDPEPGAPLYLGGAFGAGKGTSFKADKVPLAPKLYLNVYVDDDGNATAQNPWPSKGDPVHFDLEPFTAGAGQKITRNILLWARLP